MAVTITAPAPAQSLSLAAVVEANRLSSEVPYLILIDLAVVNPDTGLVVDTRRIVRNDEDVTFNGTLYTAANFDISVTSEAQKQSEVSLTVQDQTRTIQGLMETYSGGVGSAVTLYVVPANALTKPADIQEYFQIIAASSTDYVQSFTLGAENMLRLSFPKRRQTRDFCQWRFKDATTCKYAGGLATCDLSLQGTNGCEAHGNSINFGGFPGINSNGYRYS